MADTKTLSAEERAANVYDKLRDMFAEPRKYSGCDRTFLIAQAIREAEAAERERCALYHDEQRILMHDLLCTGHEDDDVLRAAEAHHKASAQHIRSLPTSGGEG